MVAWGAGYMGAVGGFRRWSNTSPVCRRSRSRSFSPEACRNGLCQSETGRLPWTGFSSCLATECQLI